MLKCVRTGGLGAALAVAFGGMASAADIYVPPAPSIGPVYTTPVPFSWAGHYYGLQGGGAWGDAKGFVLSGLGGWNWQQNNWVYGIDANAGYVFSDGFIGNIRGRLGYALADRWLVYGSGGLAATGFDGFKGGYTVGGGIEYAMWDHTNLRLDYAYTHAGRKAHTLMLGVVFKNNWLGGY